LFFFVTVNLKASIARYIISSIHVRMILAINKIGPYEAHTVVSPSSLNKSSQSSKKESLIDPNQIIPPNIELNRFARDA
jgi:hypothetical protein